MKLPFLSTVYMTLVIGVITIVALIVGKQLFIPLTLGLFLALTLAPSVAWLTQHKFPTPLAIATMFLGTGIAIGIIGSVIGIAVKDFADKVPEYITDINDNIQELRVIVSDKLPIDETVIFDQLNPENLSIIGLKTVSDIFTTTGTIAAGIGFTLVTTFLLLLYRHRIKKFFEMVATENQQAGIHTIAQKSFSVLPKYMTGMIFVIGILAVINSFAFWLIGIPSYLFWGIMVALLNVIPYVGPFIGFGAVTLFALAVSGPSMAFFAIIAFLISQFIDNNFLTPIIAAGQIAINPLAAIISIFIGGMIWGVIGMVLALPTLGLLKIIFDTIPHLQPVGYLIGDKQ